MHKKYRIELNRIQLIKVYNLVQIEYNHLADSGNGLAVKESVGKILDLFFSKLIN